MNEMLGVLAFIVFLIILKSWGDCGSDHEENESS